MHRASLFFTSSLNLCFFWDGWSAGRSEIAQITQMTQRPPVKLVCAFVCPYTTAPGGVEVEQERQRERNAQSTARHLSVPVQCLRKCTLILAIKEQIVRGAMAALTAAVQWSRLQGGRRLAQAFCLLPQVPTGSWRPPPTNHPTVLHPKYCLYAQVSVRRHWLGKSSHRRAWWVCDYSVSVPE